MIPWMKGIRTFKRNGIWYAFVGRLFPARTKRQAIEAALRWLKLDNREMDLEAKTIRWIASRGKERTTKHPMFISARANGFYD